MSKRQIDILPGGMEITCKIHYWRQDTTETMRENEPECVYS